jgi:hypothetical protein
MLNKPGDKRLLRDFDDLVELIKGSTNIDPFESAGDKRKRIKLLLEDELLFGAYYFPEYCYAPFAKFHKDAMRQVFSNPNNIFLEQFSRGFAKSVIFGMIEPLFIKFNGKLNGMMVGSHDENLAAARLADVQANLQFNKRIINDFGEQFSFGNWEDGNFKTKDNTGFYAFGKKQSPRGTRFTHKRPNYGLIDDLNDARQLKNPVIADEDKRWVLDEFKPALWTRLWWLVVAQNKFHDNAVTSLLEADDEIKTIVNRVNITDENGKSNWPENPDFSDEAIANLNESEGAGYIRERMNTPFEEGTTFKAEWMNNWVDCSEQKYDGFLTHYLDPSYKSTDKSDYKFWVLLGKCGKYYDIVDAWGEKTTSKKMWERGFDVNDEYETFTIHHSMEANFIQEEVHSKELERVEADKGRALRVSWDRRAKDDKHARVCTLQPLFERGLFRFNVLKKHTPGMKLLRTQLLAFEKGSKVNDDGPDGLEGAVWMADRFSGRKESKPRQGAFRKNMNRQM